MGKKRKETSTQKTQERGVVRSVEIEGKAMPLPIKGLCRRPGERKEQRI